MELANYQVETPNTVRLFYRDGRQMVVKENELAVHLAPLDVLKVQQALQLRQAYFRELPKWVKMILIVVLAISAGYGGVKAAPGIQRVLHEVIPAIPAPAEAVTAPAQTPASPSAAAAANQPQPAAATQPSAEASQSSPANVQLPPQASVNALLHTVNRVSPLRLPSDLPAVANTPF